MDEAAGTLVDAVLLLGVHRICPSQHTEDYLLPFFLGIFHRLFSQLSKLFEFRY